MLSASSPTPQIIGALAVRRFGSGTPLVLVHGGVGSWAHWTANLAALAQHFAVTTIDLPGFGNAPMPAAPEPERYLDAVAEDLARAMGGPFGLVGFSFGGVISAAVARRLGTRVNALTLLAPGGFGQPMGRTVSLVPVPAADTDPAGHRAAVARNLGAFMLSRTPEASDPVVDLQCANIARLRYDSRRISLQDRIIDDLAHVSCPLQVAWGTLDRLPVPSAQARADRILAVRPDAEIHFIPSAGHWVQYEAPDPVDALLIAFHKRVPE
ncbi:alpha/beta fold hydrolase [Xanthobacter sp. VNH20]|jgi:2-hydroxy-6-oxonona-2,4-dienedioate hydrolase|uniref:alpha/beta fold hydrolase n=1 Tax=Xanthobacter sp. VNH20 TaxID=3156616 RepID=UPI0032B34E66